MKRWQERRVFLSLLHIFAYSLAVQKKVSFFCQKLGNKLEGFLCLCVCVCVHKMSHLVPGYATGDNNRPIQDLFYWKNEVRNSETMVEFLEWVNREVITSLTDQLIASWVLGCCLFKKLKISKVGFLLEHFNTLTFSTAESTLNNTRQKISILQKCTQI